MFIQEHNCETGEIIERQLTQNEIRQREEENEKIKIEKEGKAAAKAALFERLGITEEEAKLLLG